MKNHISLSCILLFIFSVLFNSCASTDIEGIQKADTDFYKYQKVFVYSNLENLKYRKKLETEICKQFNTQNIEAIKSIEKLPPLKEYSTEEIKNIISETNSEIFIEVRILSIATNNGDSNSFFMPIGGMFFGSGSSEIKVNIDFDITIYDVQNNYEILFKGTATSKDENDEFEDCIENIFKSFAGQLVKQYFTLPETKNN